MLRRDTQFVPILAALVVIAHGGTADAQVAQIPPDPSVAPSPSDHSARLRELETQLQRQSAEIDRLHRQFACLQERHSADADASGFRGLWNYGLWFESDDGEFRANIGGRVEQDYVWADTDPAVEAAIGSMEDGLFFRRARIHGAGTMYGVIDLFAEFEAAPVDNIVFQDLWGQLRDVPLLGHVRIGHVKVPFGLENTTSAKYVTFMERSAVQDAFQQEYDPGIVVWNDALQQNATWAIAALRLDPAESGIAFGNGRYSGVARATLVPWSNQDDSMLVHLGGGFRHDHGGIFDPSLGQEVVRFRARPELRGTRRFVDTGPLGTSGSSFYVLEGAILLGPASLQAEYVHTTVHDASVPGTGQTLGNAEFDGVYVYASWFLTGERRPYDRQTGAMGRVVPHENVRTGTGRSILCQGAWEAAARYSYVDLNDSGINGGTLQTVSAGLTWYLNPNTKVLLNYIHAARDVPGPPADGNADLLGMRFHIAF